MGAVLYTRKGVIGEGINDMKKTHPAMQGKPWPFLHAEVAACLDAGLRRTAGASLYVARILRNGAPALAKPCPFCARFLHKAGVTHIHWSTHATAG